MDLRAVTMLFTDLQTVELTTWVERGWVLPEDTGAGWEFHEIDLARVRLIHDLRRSMDVAEDVVPLVLSLLDQVYELRSTLKTLLRAVEIQPEDTRRAILAALERR